MLSTIALDDLILTSLAGILGLEQRDPRILIFMTSQPQLGFG
jgi:hypothetical protein